MKKKMSVLRVTAHATDDSWFYHDPDSLKRITAFRRSHPGCDVDIVFEAHDGVQYWQHKYFHGYLLQEIAEGQGEKDWDYLKEFVLKEEFLKIPIQDVKDIPARHRSRCRIIQADVIQPDGEIIRVISAYIPSLSVLSYDEYRDFIVRCEEVRDGFIDWSYRDEREAKDAMYYRSMAFNQDPFQAELFAG